MRVWVVIDVGCHECHLHSEPVGIFSTKEEAEEAAKQCNERTGCRRDWGLTYAEVFEMEMP